MFRGSSPHRGIIPAYAGSTEAQTRSPRQRPGSSPHTRGAPSPARRSSPAGGDHPRIRGEHGEREGEGRRGQGIIPAYAGSTLASPRIPRARRGSSPHTRGARVIGPPTRCISRDHPRIRGEHRQDPHRCRDDAGIIPAYAGSTDCLNCGVVESTGSSPHTRGARSDYGRIILRYGIIPAYAGSTCFLGRGAGDTDGIIPAYAGSTYPLSRNHLNSLGSSPHTRGAHSTSPLCSAGRRDHPRIRGEHRLSRVQRLLASGIIPAYAGSTENSS